MWFPFGIKRRPRLKDLRKRTMVIGIGAMKSGTTWLSDYLGSNPDFYHSTIKEMNFFNRKWPSLFASDGEPFREYRKQKIMEIPDYKRNPQNVERLRALSDLDRLDSFDDYLRYFAKRMTGQTHFGEISPSYALLPPEAFAEIAKITADVRFLFLMRDPAARMASNIQHQRRRVRADESVDQIIATIEPGTAIWGRGDYGRTLDNLEAAGVMGRTKVIVYENLFRPETIEDLCQWLGLPYIAPDFGRRLNVAQSEPLTDAQKVAVREKLDPIYRELSDRFGADRPAKWQWS